MNDLLAGLNPSSFSGQDILEVLLGQAVALDGECLEPHFGAYCVAALKSSLYHLISLSSLLFYSSRFIKNLTQDMEVKFDLNLPKVLCWGLNGANFFLKMAQVWHGSKVCGFEAGRQDWLLDGLVFVCRDPLLSCSRSISKRHGIFSCSL
jgi:hypothetical protein